MKFYMKAGDLIKQLNQNPEYQEKMRVKEEELQKGLIESKNIEKPFIQDLHSNGFIEIESSSDLLKLKKINNKLSSLLLKWLPRLDNKFHSQEMIVRGLCLSENPIDGKLLMELFDNRDSGEGLKWAIANTLASTNVNNVKDWLEKKLNSNDQPTENQMLVYGAIRYFDANKAKKYLYKLFDSFPLQVADAFKYIGNIEDLHFIEEKIPLYSGPVATELKKSLKALKRKLK